MQPVINRHDSLLHSFAQHESLLTAGLHILLLLVGIYVRVELGNLVCVLYWCRHLDRSCPVEIVVTQGISQLVDVSTLQTRVVLWHVEMRGQHTTLSASCWRHKKVKPWWLFAVVLAQLLVNNTTRWWVAHVTSRVLYEESLRDALIHNNNSNLRLVGGLVVHRVDCCLKLRDLSRKHLVLLGITDTITVDHKICGELIFVLLRKGSDCCHQRLFHLVMDDLLALRLDEVVTVVLAHLLVRTGTETDNGFRTGMTHVNTNQHRSFLGKNFWELQVVQVTTSFGVDLSKDVGGLGQTELVSVSKGHNLWRNFVAQHHLLEHFVRWFPLQNTQNDSWVAELAGARNIVANLVVELLPIRFLRELNPVRLFNFEAKLLWGLAHVVVDIVCNTENSVIVFVDHDPTLLKQVLRFVDTTLAQGIVITLHDLLVWDHLRGIENLSRHSDWLSLDLDRPILDSFLVEQSLDHAVNSLEFFSGIDPGVSKSITHTSSFPHWLRYTINKAKFSRQIKVSLGDVDLKERLTGVTDPQLVCLEEVLSNRNLLTVVLKEHFDWVRVEDDVTDNVLALVTPIGNDTTIDELVPATLFKLMLLEPLVISNIADSLQAAVSWHKLKNWVYHESWTNLTLKDRSLESRHDLELAMLESLCIWHVKEAGSLTNLLKISVAEGLLDNDVNQVLGDSVVLVVKLSVKHHWALSRLFNHDWVLSSGETDFKLDIFLQLRQHVDAGSRNHVETKRFLKSAALEPDNFLDEVSVPELHTNDLECVLKNLHGSAKLESILVAHQGESLTGRNISCHGVSASISYSTRLGPLIEWLTTWRLVCKRIVSTRFWVRDCLLLGWRVFLLLLRVVWLLVIILVTISLLLILLILVASLVVVCWLLVVALRLISCLGSLLVAIAMGSRLLIWLVGLLTFTEGVVIRLVLAILSRSLVILLVRLLLVVLRWMATSIVHLVRWVLLVVSLLLFVGHSTEKL